MPTFPASGAADRWLPERQDRTWPKSINSPTTSLEVFVGERILSPKLMLGTLCIYFFQRPSEMGVIILSLLQMGTPRLQKVKPPAQAQKQVAKTQHFPNLSPSVKF